MQYGLLHRTLAVAIEILIASNLLDSLHQHDFDAITFFTSIYRDARDTRGRCNSDLAST
jgi:hypothetical protein